ncbi:MAG: hypothetical protein WA632_07970 [Gallionella sp.]
MSEEKSAAPTKLTPLKSASPTAVKPIKATAKVTATETKPAPKKVSKSAAKPASKKAAKVVKVKVIRDSFTMPQNEYEEIAKIKDTFKKAGMPVKKSEILRAGLKALVKLTVAQKKTSLAELEKIKTGRPNKH